MFPGLALYYAGPAQPLTKAGEEIDNLDDDLSDLSEVFLVFFWRKCVVGASFELVEVAPSDR